MGTRFPPIDTEPNPRQPAPILRQQPAPTCASSRQLAPICTNLRQPAPLHPTSKSRASMLRAKVLPWVQRHRRRRRVDRGKSAPTRSDRPSTVTPRSLAAPAPRPRTLTKIFLRLNECAVPRSSYETCPPSHAFHTIHFMSQVQFVHTRTRRTYTARSGTQAAPRLLRPYSFLLHSPPRAT